MNGASRGGQTDVLEPPFHHAADVIYMNPLAGEPTLPLQGSLIQRCVFRGNAQSRRVDIVHGQFL
jgi:hypothetical protein